MIPPLHELNPPLKPEFPRLLPGASSSGPQHVSYFFEQFIKQIQGVQNANPQK